jgi:S-adenosylmethionine:tRNA ribosyltransferase-isomerase
VSELHAVPLAEAAEPPEERGLGRDDVAMMVSTRGDGRIAHARFTDLPQVLRRGDLLVVNDSGTLPAALPARVGGRSAELRLSTPAEDGTWVVELRTADRRPHPAPRAGTRVELPGGAHAEAIAPYVSGHRLFVARLTIPGGEELGSYLGRHGAPIRYGYVDRVRPISAYQTVFAVEPGSAEMPSAGRPFSTSVVTALVARGVLIAPVTLHTGVSSLEHGEEPYPERYRVPPATARLVNAVRGWGGRVVAVGTTVVRALETVASVDGSVRAGAGSTYLVVTPERGLRAFDGLLTGWHEPRSSHLQLVEAATGRGLLERSYREARERGYLFHEFGDVHLVLP